jgi:hypothetical protein
MSETTQQVAGPVARINLDDAALLKLILSLPAADLTTAFKVMSTLREQGYSSSRSRINRVVAEHQAKVAAKAAKPVAMVARRSGTQKAA